MGRNAFQDALDDIQHGELVESDGDEQTKAEDSESEDARKGESVADEEQPEVQSDEEQEDSPPRDDDDDGEEPEADEEQESEPVEGDEEEDENKDDEPEGDEDQIVVIDGEEFTLAQVRDWRANGLRQSDYTRKTQELAAGRESVQKQQKLASELVEDKAFSEFIKAHPEVLPGLLRDAENTRALLGNVAEVQKLWDRYELVQDDPELAERLFTGRTTKEDEQQAAFQMRVENAGRIANHLDEVGEQIAQEFDGVEWADLSPNILRLARFPENPQNNPAETLEALERLYHIAFTQDEQGNSYADPDFLRAQFQQAASSVQRKRSQKKNKAESHNEAVDKALNKKKVPATKGGDPTAPQREELADQSFQEVMNDLMGYDG